MATTLPLLGLMLGDATGIGPEQCARVLADGRLSDAARLVVVGDARVLQQGARDAGVELAWRTYPAPEAIDWTQREIPLLDLANLDPARIARGQVSPESGRITGETLAVMVDLALSGRIDGITFAPLNKGALHAGGWRFNDEHQLFAHLTGHAGYFGEMNVLDGLWLSRATSHVALKVALQQLTAERIDQALSLADATMRGAGIARPRIAVAALNPHGGEGGLFGREEMEIIAPAIARAAARGIDCRGPFPADTVFLKARDGELGIGHRPPTCVGALTRNQPSADAVVTEAASHSARVPGGAGLRVEDERVVKRFDRGAEGERIHIEDFAQVFGVYPSRKVRIRGRPQDWHARVGAAGTMMSLREGQAAC